MRQKKICVDLPTIKLCIEKCRPNSEPIYVFALLSVVGKITVTPLQSYITSYYL
jgi:hypothetical protein